MEARRAYFQEYWKKNKVKMNQRSKAYKKEVSIEKIRSNELKTERDVWNVRRSKTCFAFSKSYINFMQPIARK